MSALSTLPRSGRTAPAPPASLLSTNTASGHRPSELDDADWLRRRYLVDGDNGIAAHLGVSSETVRRARLRHGIVSRPRGRQYGQRGIPRTDTQTLTRPRARVSACVLISQRVSEDRNAPATLGLVATRVRAVHDASQHHDRLALEDALIALASSCALCVDHLQALEAA